MNAPQGKAGSILVVDDDATFRGVLDEGVHFLRKPFTLAALSAKLREALT